jgi:predicted 3-demethylubiquinone-9 3-methyltransferase (glyoxalase superfamily)
MQKISPFLWFDGRAEEAATFYVSVFGNSRLGEVLRWNEDGPGGKKGDVLTIEFVIEGQEFAAINGGPAYQFTPAISFFVNCRTQDELDTLWRRLLEDGGKEMQCGWLADKFGVSWQIVPDILVPFLRDPDTAKAQRTMRAMMGMVKLDIAALQRAHDAA